MLEAVPLASLPDHRRRLAAAALAACDRWWDPAAGLLRDPDGFGLPGGDVPVHLVPHSGWYALGLLARDGAGDRNRAARILGLLCDLQYDEPGTVIHGTFARFLESPHPGPQPVEWEDYDPNWRQFLGTTLLLATALLGDRLEAALVDRLHRAVTLAVEGEPPDRVPASYANIALMKAWLGVEAAARLGMADQRHPAEELAAAVVERFHRHGAFDEYGSPTYYGIDLYALALWRDHSASPRLRSWGAELEAALWTDIARWYHAGLRNLCGPWTRSYGMDMTRYVGALGLWMAGEVGTAAAPLPDLAGSPDHGMDAALGPVAALLGARVPPGAAPDLTRFSGERVVEQRLPGGRVATGWLAAHCMAGGEQCPADLSGWDQYHPATVHWLLPSGGVGWIRARVPGAAAARASRRRLELGSGDGSGPARLVVRAPGASLGAGSRPGSRWQLPGLAVTVDGGAGLEVLPGHHTTEVLCDPGHGLVLGLEPTP